MSSVVETPPRRPRERVAALPARLHERAGRTSVAWIAAGLAVLAAAWIVLVALMTSNGFSGNSRYLMPPAALLTVLGAAGIVWLLRWMAGRRSSQASAAVVAAAAAALAVAFAYQDAGDRPEQVTGAEYQAEMIDGLGPLVERAGGAEFLRSCGHAYTNPFVVPQVAWHLGVHSQQVDLDPDEERPAVVFHVRHVREAAGRAPAWAKRGRHEIAREGTWIVTADCDAAAAR